MVLLLALAATRLAAQAAPGAAASSPHYTLAPTIGRMSGDGVQLDLLQVEILQVVPGRLGGRFAVGTIRDIGVRLVDTEIGPALAIPLTRGAMLVPAGTLVFDLGDGFAWGLAAGAGLLIEPAGRVVLRLHAARRWYRADRAWYDGLTTVSLGIGVRLGDAGGAGGRDAERGLHSHR